jgi:hypothetical protein
MRMHENAWECKVQGLGLKHTLPTENTWECMRIQGARVRVTTHQKKPKKHYSSTWFFRDCRGTRCPGSLWSCCHSTWLSKVSWEVCQARRSFSSIRRLLNAASFQFMLTSLADSSFLCFFSRYLQTQRR